MAGGLRRALLENCSEMKTPPTITRKELVALSGFHLTERVIYLREREWGLFELRLPCSRRPVYYRRLEAILIVKKIMGW